MLVRYNPDGDAEMNTRQTARLKRLADWLHDNDRKFLFELLVPATDDQLESVGGDADRYDTELRPELMSRTIAELPGRGRRGRHLEDRGRRRARGLRAHRRPGPHRRARRRGLRRARPRRDDEKVDQWLRAGAPVDGYVGFAIGRSIWWDALKALPRRLARARAAAEQIAENYLRFVKVYEEAAGRERVAYDLALRVTSRAPL